MLSFRSFPTSRRSTVKSWHCRGSQGL
jgi:hypothetical protein